MSLVLKARCYREIDGARQKIASRVENMIESPNSIGSVKEISELRNLDEAAHRVEVGGQLRVCEVHSLISMIERRWSRHMHLLDPTMIHWKSVKEYIYN